MKAILAVSLENQIGTATGLPWQCKMDLKFFKSITENQTVLMGRKTMELMPGGLPLANRRNLVLSKSLPAGNHNGFEIINHPGQLPEETKDIIIIGGAEIYKLFARDIKELYVNEIDCWNNATDKSAVYLDLSLLTRGMQLTENISKGSKSFIAIGKDLGLKNKEIFETNLNAMKKYERL